MVRAVELRRVSHRYGRTVALDSIDLMVTGGLVGLLGPNGAGKSTLIALVATLLRPQAGVVRVMDRDVRSRPGRAAARRAIGLLPQRFALVPSMRVQDTVAYAAWVNGVPSDRCMAEAAVALAAVGMEDHARTRVRTLSGGQRQRLGVAAAISHKPALLILDEPTVGIDPVARVQLRRHLNEIARHRTVIVSTHLVEDVVHLCERIVVLNDGKVVYDGATAALVEFSGALSPLASPLEAAYEQLLAGKALP